MKKKGVKGTVNTPYPEESLSTFSEFWWWTIYKALQYRIRLIFLLLIVITVLFRLFGFLDYTSRRSTAL